MSDREKVDKIKLTNNEKCGGMVDASCIRKHFHTVYRTLSTGINYVF